MDPGTSWTKRTAGVRGWGQDLEGTGGAGGLELLLCGELSAGTASDYQWPEQKPEQQQGHQAKLKKQTDVDGLLASLEPILKDDSLLGHGPICAIDKSAPGREGPSGEEMSLEAGLSLKFHVY